MFITFSPFQFFISALSFATFAVSPELPQNRLQLSFTLLLTSVAFKFVINQSLPKISYLTYMVSGPPEGAIEGAWSVNAWPQRALKRVPGQ